MPGAFQPAVPRPEPGHALVVAGQGAHAAPVALLHRMGLVCEVVNDPYSAMVGLVRRGGDCRAMVLNLQSLFREELVLISAVKGRYPKVEIWLTHAEGRMAALAEAMRYGADALVSEDGLHRLTPEPPPVMMERPAQVVAPPVAAPVAAPRPVAVAPTVVPSGSAPVRNISRIEPVGVPREELAFNEPVLTADELRALLHEDGSANGGG